ncbi:phage portal protein [Sodaliphilus pleomorphus]|uniref:Phage portal protein n=1 Tax=Sodaliphilus pleomorphus TaxID=2606626 RepID=A0A6L5X7B6_9BACT|nr:phage portal protein [Sodaliphilus pleomorphus]MSS16201.1 phage portal protein [Sodaliphilus pleomorphus]
MGLLKTLGFITKSATPVEGGKTDVIDTAARRLQLMREIAATPYVANANFITLFNTVPEVAWPVNYIASRAAGAKYVLKKFDDDSVVWNNEAVNRILVKPNSFDTWYRTLWKHFAYKLVTGNSFIKAAMSDAFSGAKTLYKWCDRYVTLEEPYVTIEYKRQMGDIYGVSDVEDVVQCYYHDYGQFVRRPIAPQCVFHDVDDTFGFYNGDPLKAKSRLCSVLKAISNLIAVYEARNVIYVKRGGLGWLVSEMADDMGSRALTSTEKKQILEEADKMYGFGEGKYPYGISDVKLSFVRTNLSITDLQPFDETLADAVVIAGIYGIPPVLIPRKDQSTYSNQANAEKAVYSSVIIPLVQRFCQEFTHFLGLDQDGLYLDADFSGVDCLQAGKKEEQEVHRSIADRCKMEFESGIITLNDWRAQQGYQRVEDTLYDKLVSEMTPEEIQRLKQFINPKTEEDEGDVSAPALQDEGE